MSTGKFWKETAGLSRKRICTKTRVCVPFLSHQELDLVSCFASDLRHFVESGSLFFDIFGKKVISYV